MLKLLNTNNIIRSTGIIDISFLQMWDWMSSILVSLLKLFHSGDKIWIGHLLNAEKRLFISYLSWLRWADFSYRSYLWEVWRPFRSDSPWLSHALQSCVLVCHVDDSVDQHFKWANTSYNRSYHVWELLNSVRNSILSENVLQSFCMLKLYSQWVYLGVEGVWLSEFCI